MSGVVFLETLRRHARTMLYWALGVASMAVYIVLVIPDMSTLTKYNDLIKGMPTVLLSALGASDTVAMGTPAGFLGYSFFGWIMLVLAVYGVISGLDITANDEDRGTLDVLLSLPLPRWRIVIEKFAAYALAVVVIALTSLIVLLWGIRQSPALQTISDGQVIAGTLNFIPSTLLVMAFTAAVAVVVRRRNAAAGIAAVFVIASWFVDTLGRSAPSLDTVRTFSFFRYYDSMSVVLHGFVIGNVVLLVVIAVLLLAGAVTAFERRDIGL